MNYKIGDEVVCIDGQSMSGWRFVNKYRTIVRAGEKYIVAGMEECCMTVLHLRGVTGAGRGTRCQFCGHIFDGFPQAAWRFIKLDGIPQETKELEREM